MWIVKLGGSLANTDALRPWLDVLADAGRGRIVIVPGGGPFADAVRRAQERWSFDHSVAHRLALLAMGQYGLMLCGIHDGLTAADSDAHLRATLESDGVPVWLPLRMADGVKDIPESWEVTSDSLAAWLAARMEASHLLLVKSCPIPHHGLTPDELTRLGIVDARFADFAYRGNFKTVVLGRDDYTSIVRLLRNEHPLPSPKP